MGVVKGKTSCADMYTEHWTGHPHRKKGRWMGERCYEVRMKKRKRGGYQWCPDLWRLRLSAFMSGVMLAGIGASERAKGKSSVVTGKR